MSVKACLYILLYCLTTQARDQPGAELSFFMYQRESTSDSWNNSSTIIHNNSVALPDNALGSQYGIVCASLGIGEGTTRSINWYYPNGGPVTSDHTNPNYRIFSKAIHSSGSELELRKSGNMRRNDSGIHTCILSDSISVHILYLALYYRPQSFQMVELKARIEVEVNSAVGVLLANCTSVGLPAEEVDWLLDDSIVSAGKRRQAITDRVLVVYSTFLTLEASDVATNGSQCLKCQAKANRTNMTSGCVSTKEIVPLAPTPRRLNGSHLWWWDVEPGSFPIIGYYLRISGGHCNKTSLWYRHTSNFTKVNDIVSLSLNSMDFLHAGAFYLAEVKATNGFSNSSWSNSTMLTTFPKPPSGVPMNLSSKSNSTSIFLCWSEVDCSERNGNIDSYFVAYENVMMGGTRTKIVGEPETILTNLLPSSVYNISLAAFNREVEMGPFITLSVKTTDLATEDLITTEFENGTPAVCAQIGFPSAIICAIASAVTIGILLLLLCLCCLAIICRISIRRKPYSDLVTEDVGLDIINIPCDSMEVKPSIDIFPEDMEVLEGEHVIFDVSVSGRPRPSLTWYHNSKEIEKDPSISISSNGTLSITSVETEHAGVYKLKGASSAGSTSAEFNVVLAEEEEYPLRRHESVASIVCTAAVPVASFDDYIAHHHIRNNRKFYIEFVSLDSCSNKPTSVGMSTENKNCNRFKNITPYDDSLVVLRPLEGCEDHQNEYINASYMDGYGNTSFIATQGPLPHTLSDFWRMVWQERSRVIVMLCDIVEGRRVRCHQYWPETGIRKYGAITVQHLEKKQLADYIVRTLEVTIPELSERRLKVKQYQYTSWPHHSVPDNAGAFVSFCKVAAASDNDSNTGPIVVHDSAGVGRTGVFIALNKTLYQAKENGEISIMEIVSSMREQRMKMVQTLSEFVFVHDSTLEALVCGETLIPVPDFCSTWNRLNRTDKETGTTGLEKQFQLLVKITPNPSEVDRKAGLQWPSCNRCTKYLPRDKGRVIIKSEDDCDYIHASFVNGYKKKKAFIIAQGPLKNTCDQFWQMIHQYHCKTIVMLSELNEYNQEVCYQYWPEVGQATYGSIDVSPGTECCVGDMITRNLRYKDKSDNKTEWQSVSHIQLLNWTPEGLCADYQPVVELIKNVMQIQMQNGNPPIIVHCSDTVSRSPIFCAAMTAIECFMTEFSLDIFHVVKLLRHQKPGAVLTVDQYSAIYSIVLAFADSNSGYANFKKLHRSIF